MRTASLRSSSPERVCESLYRRHAEGVYRYTLGLLDRPADAEDATQTTFLNAYRALERGERPRNARTWLHAIALNVCREYYRRARRRPDEVSLEEDPGELVLDPPAHAIGDVVRGLRQLPFNQRAALVMREFEGRSVAEIAVALEVSSPAVETLLFRARRSLREQLDEMLTCADAEQAISRQLDGALPPDERGPLRAHLRQCPECATLARRLRAQGSAIKSLALVPIPATLALGRLTAGGAAGATASASGGVLGLGASGSVLGSIAVKLAAVTLAGAAAASVGYVSLSHKSSRPADSPRLASTAERGTYPDAAAAKPVGRGGRTVGATASVAFGHRHPAATAAAHPRVGRSSTTSSTTSPASQPGLPATAQGHAYGHSGGVRAHGSPSGGVAHGSPSQASGNAGASHPTHPTHPPHPVTPSNTATTPSSPVANQPNHGSGNGTGKGNAKHQ